MVRLDAAMWVRGVDMECVEVGADVVHWAEGLANENEGQ